MATIPAASSTMKTTTKVGPKKTIISKATKTEKKLNSAVNKEKENTNFQQSTGHFFPSSSSGGAVGDVMMPFDLSTAAINSSSDATSMLDRHIDDQIDAAITRSMKELQLRYDEEMEMSKYEESNSAGTLVTGEEKEAEGNTSRIPIPIFSVTSPRPHSSRPASAPRHGVIVLSNVSLSHAGPTLAVTANLYDTSGSKHHILHLASGHVAQDVFVRLV